MSRKINVSFLVLSFNLSPIASLRAPSAPGVSRLHIIPGFSSFWSHPPESISRSYSRTRCFNKVPSLRVAKSKILRRKEKSRNQPVTDLGVAFACRQHNLLRHMIRTPSTAELNSPDRTRTTDQLPLTSKLNTSTKTKALRNGV